VTVKTTFSAPTRCRPKRGDRDAFVDLIANSFFGDRSRRTADAVDGFCEGIAFARADFACSATSQRWACRSSFMPTSFPTCMAPNLRRATALCRPTTSNTPTRQAAAMAKAGTVATILPGAYYFSRETRKPPVGLFRQHGVRMAVATDCNPGTSPLTSLLLTMNMAATLFGLTVDECLAGTTREAARALGLLGQTGTLEAGKSADLAIWDIERPAELVYRMGFNPLHARIWRGQ
jgi:imidazolonepropionase